MISNRYKCMSAIMGLCLFFSTARARESYPNDSIANTDTSPRESIFDIKSPTLDKSHFTWGAEVGASIDLGGYDMSTFDLDVIIGYKNDWFKTIGICSGIHRDFHKGNNLIPIMGVIRTSFSDRPRWWFYSLKAGYSFNSFGDLDTSGGFILNTGIGFNMVQSRRFNCHLVLSYQFLHLSGDQQVMVDKKRDHIDMAQITFGVNF